MRKFVLGYTVALLVTVLAVAGLAQWGAALYPAPAGTLPLAAVAPAAALPLAAVAPAAAAPPLLTLLLQMLVVIGVARLCGQAFRRIGQPAVVGEIFAGILLGPSLLGLLWPQALAALFPPGGLAPLQLLGQIGVLLFMFGVGLEVDLGELRPQTRAALVISHASMALPFLLGMGLALAAFPLLAPPGLAFHAFALFLGIAMSITAFPVLARILEERRLMHTPLGRMAIACAAIGDVSAWCLLALVVALVHAHGPASAARSAGLALLFVLALHR
ncbi:MAG TPA: cation:proton antiporter, partial [Nevskia sp.]|nr:cation:proton antiporter [Nevskia sp.]